MNRVGLNIWVLLRRITIAIIGSLVILLGIFLLPAPGPGILVILGGMAILAFEFTWARKLLRKMREWTSAMARRKRDARKESATPD